MLYAQHQNGREQTSEVVKGTLRRWWGSPVSNIVLGANKFTEFIESEDNIEFHEVSCLMQCGCPERAIVSQAQG